MKTSKSKNIVLVLVMVSAAFVISCNDDIMSDTQTMYYMESNTVSTNSTEIPTVEKIAKTDEEWRELLTQEQYLITREKGTEPAFSGIYNDHKEDGVYSCICCDNKLFSSETKYESGTGWPSFWKQISERTTYLQADFSNSMRRTEVLCSRCDAHLGHITPDGPEPTGMRYCINSVALSFRATPMQ